MSTYFRLMRLHQPVGIWLLLWPCWWAIALASPGLPPLTLLVLFAAGAVVMRGAGCVVNDMCDKDFDRKVARTKDRPLASGEINTPQALAFLAVLLAVALMIAWVLGQKVIFWSALALPLVAIYPLMKRITWWPQLFLGITFNWGVLVGWVAASGEITLPALLLYAGCVFWTLGYDTIYAHQDKADDALIGVKSTALRLGKNSKTFVAVCYSIFVCCFIGCLFMLSSAPLWPVLLCVIAYGLMLANLLQLPLDNAGTCRQSFVAQAQIAGIFFLATLIA